MTPEARERSFDELARGLASGEVSRSKALRLMGAALVGGALASVPRVAAAQDGVCSASACCQCGYAERDNPDEITRRRCFPQNTRSCSSRRQDRLFERCTEKCRENRPRGTVVVGTGTQSFCNPGGLTGVQTICGGGGVGRNRCGDEPCDPPA